MAMPLPLPLPLPYLLMMIDDIYDDDDGGGGDDDDDDDKWVEGTPSQKGSQSQIAAVWKTCMRACTICAPRVENLRDIWISAYCNLPMRGSGSWSIDLNVFFFAIVVSFENQRCLSESGTHH
jgi:hypothetical protein